MLETMRFRVFRRSSAAIVVTLAIAACAKSGNSPSSGDPTPPGGGFGLGASTGSGSGDPAGSASPGAGENGGGLVVRDSSVPFAGDACQHFDVQFVPKTPLVFVLADRSGSMFDAKTGADGGTTNEWNPLRTATLAVIQGLQTQVAFGFGAYTGINPNTTPAMCPVLPTVPIALNNYSAISTLYASLGQPTFKAETPAQMSLERVAQTLTQAVASQADAGQAGSGLGQPGGKYILFVTDGETDFCDDGNAVCPADAVIAELQKLYGQGIQTMVLAIDSTLTGISGPVLQGFANAGVGVTPLAPPSSAAGAPLLPTDIYNQCNGVPGWNQLFTAAGLASGQALGTYPAPDASVTNAPLYSPDATNVADLTSKIASALATVKSCSFDLQGKIKVDLPNAGRGTVSVDGTVVPYDATNGWTMTTATQLDFVGTVCQDWRTKGMNVSFNFPCDVIISIAK
jgi:hypothetical protein